VSEKPAADQWNKRLFHRVPGGVPDDPRAARQRKSDPKKDATLTLDVLKDAFWGLVVTQHHLDICDRTGLAPAVAFKVGLEKMGGDQSSTTFLSWTNF
jgi:hypothetical protein